MSEQDDIAAMIDAISTRGDLPVASTPSPEEHAKNMEAWATAELEKRGFTVLQARATGPSSVEVQCVHGGLEVAVTYSHEYDEDRVDHRGEPYEYDDGYDPDEPFDNY